MGSSFWAAFSWGTAVMVAVTVCAGSTRWVSRLAEKHVNPRYAKFIGYGAVYLEMLVFGSVVKPVLRRFPVTWPSDDMGAAMGFLAILPAVGLLAGLVAVVYVIWKLSRKPRANSPKQERPE